VKGQEVKFSNTQEKENKNVNNALIFKSKTNVNIDGCKASVSVVLKNGFLSGRSITSNLLGTLNDWTLTVTGSPAGLSRVNCVRLSSADT